MLKRTLIAATLFTLLTCSIAFWDHVHLRPTDLDVYRRSIIEGAPQRSRHALQSHPAKQERTQVQKDFWIPQESFRKHLRIIGETSQLEVSERNGKMEAREKLNQLEGWMFEEHQSRHFTAEKGTYYYPSHRFFAQSVHLEFFRNSDIPFLQGTAEQASFSASGASPLFKAEKLKADFNP